MRSWLDELRSWGCDVEGALERMCDDEKFYIECLHEIAEDQYYAKLKRALDAGDISEAFNAAHSLKGVLANVGLTPMYDQIVEIVEPLRSGVAGGLDEKYERLMQMRAKLRAVIAGS